MLHVLAGLEVVLPAGIAGRLPDPMPTIKGSQGFVRELGAAGGEF